MELSIQMKNMKPLRYYTELVRSTEWPESTAVLCFFCFDENENQIRLLGLLQSCFRM